MQAKKKTRGKKIGPVAEAPTDLPPRERILNSAFGAFMELGYAKTSMLEIATRARVSKRDLYTYFADKGAMLAVCIEGRARKMRLPLELPVPKSSAGLAHTLMRFGMAMLQEGTLPTSIAVFRLAIGESDPEVANVLNAVAREANRTALVDYLANAQRQNLVGPGDPRMMAGQFLSLLWGDLLMSLLLRASDPPDVNEIERRTKEALRVLLLVYGAEPSQERAPAR
jgi:AcrR family transcriptional regulator